MRAIVARLNRPYCAGGVGAALAVGAGLVFMFLVLGRPLRHASYDLPFFLFRSGSTNEQIWIVDLDEDSYTRLEQDPKWFDSAYHAQLVRKLTDAGAKLILFDILLVDTHTPPKGDEMFAAACRASSNVILAATLVEAKSSGIPAKTVLRAREPLRSAAAAWGLADVAAEEDRTVRQHYQDDTRYPSLARKAAELLNASPFSDQDDSKRRWFNYYAPRPFRHLSYFAALTNDLPREIRNAIVLVGRADFTGYARDEREDFRSPWSYWNNEHWFGSEIHALTLANLLNHDWLTEASGLTEWVIVLVAGAGSGFLLATTGPLAATLLALLLGGAIFAGASLLQLNARVWFPWLVPVAVEIPIALGWAVLVYSVRSYLESAFLRRSLALYLSPAQVDEIIRQPELLKPGVRRCEVSILCTDITNFSKIAEALNPEALARVLNAYYETAIEAIQSTGGTVMDLIGDAILAIWNAPTSQTDHRNRAVEAAQKLIENLDQFDAKTALPLRTRVGLHSGEVSVGNIGSTKHFDYAILGDNVNIASRLEGLNKMLNTRILASGDTLTDPEGVPCRLVGYFRFKGINRPKEIYELCVGEEAKRLAQNDSFTNALQLFIRRDFQRAGEVFRDIVRRDPKDGVSAYYIKEAAKCSNSPPPEDWMGAIDLSEK